MKSLGEGENEVLKNNKSIKTQTLVLSTGTVYYVLYLYGYILRH